MKPDATARAAVVAAAQRLEALGLNQGTAGNVGLRVGRGMLVTPTGLAPADLTVGRVVSMTTSGEVGSGQFVPTSEWRLHAAVLSARPDVDAVVHTHSPEATAVACLRRALPAVHYVIARARVTEVPCAAYATYGTAELAANVVTALGQGLACLMANHGVLTVGVTLDAAVTLAADIEWLAAVYRRAVTAGEPVVLSDDEVARVAGRFETYGQHS